MNRPAKAIELSKEFINILIRRDASDADALLSSLMLSAYILSRVIEDAAKDCPQMLENSGFPETLKHIEVLMASGFMAANQDRSAVLQ